MSGRVEIGSGALTAEIDLVGAELCSLKDADGREYITDGDPRWWAHHAPLLFPIIGELAGGRYRTGGREYRMGRHGFARGSRFELVAHEAGRATFRLTDSEETRATYPFAFALEVHFALVGTTLSVCATVRNRGAEEMPFSLGFHPGFAWPLPGGGDRLDHRIIFVHAEPQPIRRLTPDGLVDGSAASPVEGRVLAPTPDMFAHDALVWDEIASRSVRFEGDGGRPSLRIDFPDALQLGIWQKVGAPFLCIEPWQGLADPAGFAGELRDKPGIVRLPAGEERSFRMDVTVEPA